MSAPAPGGPRTSHSSGPSHSAARGPSSHAVFGVVGSGYGARARSAGIHPDVDLREERDVLDDHAAAGAHADRRQVVRPVGQRAARAFVSRHGALPPGRRRPGAVTVAAIVPSGSGA